MPTPRSASYLIFQSDDAAVADAKGRLPTLGRNAPVLPPGNPYQSKADAIIGRIFTVFQKLYPQETAGLQAPRAVMADAPDAEAFAVRNPGKDPWYIVFHAGGFDASEDELLAVVAHEMAHLVLMNADDRIRQSYQRYYLVDGDELNVFGALQTNNPAVEEHAKSLEFFRERAGGFGLSELGGIPVWQKDEVTPPSWYGKIFKRVYELTKANSPNPSACAQFETESVELIRLLTEHFEPIGLILTLDDGHGRSSKR